MKLNWVPSPSEGRVMNEVFIERRQRVHNPKKTREQAERAEQIIRQRDDEPVQKIDFMREQLRYPALNSPKFFYFRPVLKMGEGQAGRRLTFG